MSLQDIICALEECEKLKKVSVTRSDNKHIFGDFGMLVKYTCAGVQASRNSPFWALSSSFSKYLLDANTDEVL
jgi:hypothetical protein